MNQIAFMLMVLFVAFSSMSAGLALAIGLLYALIVTNPWPALSKKWVSPCLGLAIIGLGASMDITVVLDVGLRGLGYTLFTIAATLLLAYVLGRMFKVEPTISALLGVGTAICGGSAIAAASGALRAKPEQISVAMVTVFSLNALALYLFPPLGAAFHLSEAQFGLWSALAVHDTSAVVATSLKFGPEALAVGTTVKLARALWIAPVTMVMAFFWPNSEEKRPLTLVPWFIIGFIVMATLTTYLPELKAITAPCALIGKRLLVLALFLVGTSMSFAAFKTVGLRALAQGVLLWLVISSGTLALIRSGIIVH